MGKVRSRPRFSYFANRGSDSNREKNNDRELGECPDLLRSYLGCYRKPVWLTEAPLPVVLSPNIQL
jgi:hypothetical protein